MNNSASEMRFIRKVFGYDYRGNDLLSNPRIGFLAHIRYLSTLELDLVQ